MHPPLWALKKLRYQGRARAILLMRDASYIKSVQCLQPRIALLCMQAGLTAREPRTEGYRLNEPRPSRAVEPEPPKLSRGTSLA